MRELRRAGLRVKRTHLVEDLESAGREAGGWVVGESETQNAIFIFTFEMNTL